MREREGPKKKKRFWKKRKTAQCIGQCWPEVINNHVDPHSPLPPFPRHFSKENNAKYSAVQQGGYLSKQCESSLCHGLLEYAPTYIYALSPPPALAIATPKDPSRLQELPSMLYPSHMLRPIDQRPARGRANVVSIQYLMSVLFFFSFFFPPFLRSRGAHIVSRSDSDP